MYLFSDGKKKKRSLYFVVCSVADSGNLEPKEKAFRDHRKLEQNTQKKLFQHNPHALFVQHFVHWFLFPFLYSIFLLLNLCVSILFVLVCFLLPLPLLLIMLSFFLFLYLFSSSPYLLLNFAVVLVLSTSFSMILFASLSKLRLYMSMCIETLTVLIHIGWSSRHELILPKRNTKSLLCLLPVASCSCEPLINLATFCNF